MTTKTGTLGFLGGMDIGLIHRFAKGFEEGARSVRPDIRVLENYVGVTDAAWNNPGRGKELALAQIAKGADIIFTAAGNSGLGAFDAVEEKGRDATGRATHFVIGVDSNQNMVKPGFVLTSMVKRVDNAVYEIVREVKEKRFKAGLHVFGLESDGVGYAVDEYNRRPPQSRRDRGRRSSQAHDHRRGDQGDRCDVPVITAGLWGLCRMLELRNISKRFGSVVANDRINIKVDPGTIHAIVGENGAGKSTAMRIAYGFYTADAGDILVDGNVRSIKRPHDAIAPRHRHGSSALHAGRHHDGRREHRARRRVRHGDRARSRRRRALGFERCPRNSSCRSIPTRVVENLSVGQQQRVELLKALYRRAQLLILDEPTAVLTPQEVEEFFAILRGMREQGKTIVIITHKLAEVLALSDDVTVMRDGKVVGRVKTRDTNAAELARLMVGREVLLRVDKPAANPAR